MCKNVIWNSGNELAKKLNKYRGFEWGDGSDLAVLLGKSESYLEKRLADGKSYEEIIDSYLDNNSKEELTIKRKPVARFEKVSFDEFKNAWEQALHYGLDEDAVKEIYNSIKIPKRSTKRSSGYDFFYPGLIPTVISKGVSKVIPTGIRCIFLEDGYDLSIYPRSGMGFKHRLHLDNTVGIIDNDYFEADNEGHIMIKLSCDPRTTSSLTINPGDKFAQGIIRKFFLAEEEEIENVRSGGIGSTGK